MSKVEETRQVKNKNDSIFHHLDAENLESSTSVIESLCFNCGDNGTTRLLLTKIPHYKDVILMSFECEHCGFQNNEIQSGGKINEKGIKITLKITSDKDLNRQVVNSDYTSIKIPELDFEIPSQSKKGEVTTIEGIINRSISGLTQDQSRRRQENPETADKIDLIIAKLARLLNDPFTIIFEDITGECHVENPNAPQKDDNCKIRYFVRSEKQNKLLGIYIENSKELLHPSDPESFTLEELEGEVMQFPTNCPECNCPCTTNMKMTNIPHFKEVVIMATTCDSCGHRTNEVKSGGGVEPQGIKIEIIVKGKNDFSRDVLKSETCSIEIPELELEVGCAALGGRFTTVEGILVATKEQLSSDTAFTGDSKDETTAKNMEDFLDKLDQILRGEREVTIILDDPAGNSYIQSLSDAGCDERLKIVKYNRNFEQNEDLGLNDMKVENY